MGKKRTITKGDDSSGAKENASQAPKVSRSKKQLLSGVINIFSSYNNTLVSIADSSGNVAVSSSAGLLGFKGARKSTPYAATIVAKDAVEKGKRMGLQEASIVVKGVGPGREAAIRGIIGSGVDISSIIDDTPIPHNGVRPVKPRRV